MTNPFGFDLLDGRLFRDRESGKDYLLLSKKDIGVFLEMVGFRRFMLEARYVDIIAYARVKRYDTILIEDNLAKIELLEICFLRGEQEYASMSHKIILDGITVSCISKKS